ncbi:MAG: flavoprotein [Alistipes indistinctus]
MGRRAGLIAPATANTIAKMATGVADNLLLTTYLSARCPGVRRPGDGPRHVRSSDDPRITSAALQHATAMPIIEPASGELASGLSKAKDGWRSPHAIARGARRYLAGEETPVQARCKA